MNLKDLDLTSCRLAGSNDLCDEITLPLERALSVLELTHERSADAAVLAVIEVIVPLSRGPKRTMLDLAGLEETALCH